MSFRHATLNKIIIKHFYCLQIKIVPMSIFLEIVQLETLSVFWFIEEQRFYVFILYMFMIYYICL